jgi:hypothetical protein
MLTHTRRSKETCALSATRNLAKTRGRDGCSSHTSVGLFAYFKGIRVNTSKIAAFQATRGSNAKEEVHYCLIRDGPLHHGWLEHRESSRQQRAIHVLGMRYVNFAGQNQPN